MARKKAASRGKPDSRPKAKARRSSGPGRLLSAEQIRSLIRPPENFEELTEKVVEAWNRLRGQVKIPGISPNQLSSLLKRARQRQQLEKRLRERLELAIKRAQHARLAADDAAWRGVLRVWRFVKPYASENEQVRSAFLFLAEALSRPRAEAEKQMDATPPKTEPATGAQPPTETRQ